MAYAGIMVFHRAFMSTASMSAKSRLQFHSGHGTVDMVPTFAVAVERRGVTELLADPWGEGRGGVNHAIQFGFTPLTLQDLVI